MCVHVLAVSTAFKEDKKTFEMGTRYQLVGKHGNCAVLLTE